MSRLRAASDRGLMIVLVAPLAVAAIFAAYRLATRSPAPPPPSIQQQLRDAAILVAETRLERALTDDERALVRVERDEHGNWRASYDEPLHSRIPGPSSGPARVAPPLPAGPR